MILFNLVCNLTMFWKSWILTCWPQGQGMGWLGLCGQNICYHVAAFMFPFNVICNLIMFQKSWILTFWPQPLRQPRGSGTGLWSNIAFDMFLIYCNSVCMRNFCKKKMTTDWVIAKFTYLTFGPTGGRGGNLLITVMLIYRHKVITAYSEKL